MFLQSLFDNPKSVTFVTFGAGITGTGDITNAYIARLAPYSTGTGNIGTLYGLSIGNLSQYSTPSSQIAIDIDANTGAVGTNKYGIRIGNVSGAATNNYAIYTNAGLNRLGDQLSVIGSADTQQLIVKGNATQTSNLAEFQNSSSTPLVTIDNSGDINAAGTASISGSLTFKAGAGTIQTTTFSPLVLGGNTTGNITVSASNDIAGGFVAPNVDDRTDLGLASNRWRNIYGTTITGNTIYQGVNQVCDFSGTGCPASFGVNFWQLNTPVISPANTSYDLAIGGTGTASAKFQAFGAENTTSGIARLISNLTSTGNVLNATASAITTGNILNLGYGGTTAFSGNLLNMDMNSYGGGTFTGKFIELNNNGLPKFTVDSAGTASISGNANLATFIDGNGNISSTNRNNLTLGNSATYNTTGDILLNPNGTGNVGIGTTSPLTNLAINGLGIQYALSGVTAQLEVSDTQSMAINDGGSIVFRGIVTGTTQAAFGQIHGGKENSTDNNAAGYLSFFTRPAGTTLFERMRIDSAGNVGIGTTTPTALLDVNGNASVSGTLAFHAGTGTIQTTTFSSLVLGGSTTGNITISASNDIAGGFVAPNVTNVTDLGLSNKLWRNIYGTTIYQGANQVCDVGGNCNAVTGYWTQANGALFPTNNTVDVLFGANLGATATTSAHFAFTNITGSGIPTASIAGTAPVATYIDGNGNFSTTNRAPLVLGNSASGYNTTGNILLNPNGTGYVGIGTANPTANLQVRVGTNQNLRVESNGELVLEAVNDALTLNVPMQFGASEYNFLGGGNVGIGTSTPVVPLDVAGAASISGSLTFRAGAGSIQTTTSSPLTIGGNTSGNIILDALNHVAGGYVVPGANGTTDLGLSGTAWRNIYGTTIYQGANQVCDFSGTGCPASFGINYWQLNSPVLSPANTTYDLAIGGTGTASAKFQAFGAETGTSGVAKLTSTITNTGNVLEATGSAITSGNITKIGYGGTGSVTGNAILAEVDTYGGGSFTGNFLKFNNNGLQVFAVGPTGTITLQNGETIDNATNGTVNIGTTTLKLTGGTTLVSDQANVDVFNTGTTGTLNVGGAAATLNFQGASGATVNVGNANGATALNLSSGTGDVNVTSTDLITLFPTTATRIGAASTYASFAPAGDLTFVDAGSGTNIIGANGGALAISAGTSQALNLTGNAASTLNFGANTLAITSSDFTVDSSGNSSQSGTLTFGGTATIQSTATRQLTLGGTTTGNITLDALNHVAGGNVVPGANNVTDLGLSGTAWRNIYGTTIYQGAFQVCDASGTGCPSSTNYWSVYSNNTIYPTSTNLDLLLGSSATASAKFAFTGVGSGVPIASIAGTSPVATYIDGNGNFSTTNRAPLVLGNSATYNTTGNILLNPNGTGNVGIGTTAPAAPLHVVGNGLFTAPTAVFNLGFIDSDVSTGGYVGPAFSANAFAAITELSASNGGVALEGGSQGTTQTALQLSGFVFSNTVNDSTPVVNIVGSKKVITGDESALTSTNTLLRVDNFTTPVFTILGSGNVGIGTTNPIVPLDVAGAASISGSLTFRAGASSIQTTTSSPLTIGGNTSGNIILDALNHIAGGYVVPGANNVTDLGLSGTAWRNIYGTTIYQGANQVCDTSGNCTAGTDVWTVSNGAYTQKYSTADVLLGVPAGATATASAKFAFLNMLTGTGTPTASISGTAPVATFVDGNGNISSTNRNNLTLGNSATYNTTGNILLNPNGTGFVGVGTVSPSTTMDINGSSLLANTTAINPDSFSNRVLAGAITDTSFALTNGIGGNVGTGRSYAIGAVAGGSFYMGYGNGSSTTSIQTFLQVDTNRNLYLTPISGNVGIGTTTPTALLDVNGNASVSGTLAFHAGTGTIQTTTFSPLILGGNTTGNLTISASNDIAGGFVAPNVTNVTDLGLSNKLWRNIYGTAIYQGAFQVCDTSGTGCPSSTNYWSVNSNNTIYPTSTNLDLLLGSSATASAKFAFKNVATGTPTASISGTAPVATFIDGNGNISSTNRNNLTLGNSATYNSTGNILLNPNGTGNVGIGTTAPLTAFMLDVESSGNNGIIASTTTGTGIQGSSLATSGTGIYGYTNGSSATGVNGYNASSGKGVWGGTMTGYGVYGQSYSSGTGGYFTSSSGYSLITGSGNAGIGTTSPTALLDVNGNASVSGTLAFHAGTGTIQTTNFSDLVLGGNTSGNITISASNDIAGGFVAPNVTNVTDLGLSNKLWRNIYGTTIYQGANQVCDTSGNCTAGTDVWAVSNGAYTQKYTTADVLLGVPAGASATASAKFAFLNMLTGTGTPTASISGTAPVATYIDGNGNISTTNRANLVLGNSATYNTTGNILLNPSGAGNVGIGTTNPNRINATASATLTIETSTTGANQNSPTLEFSRNSDTFAPGAELGVIRWFGGSTSHQQLSAITSKLDGTGTVPASGTRLEFYTTPPSGSITQRMVIDSSGNVGIGYSSPTHALDVNGSIYQGVNQVCDQSGTGCPAGFTNLWQLTTNSLSPSNSTYALNIGNTASASALFHVPGTNNDNSWFNLGTGNVGVGITNPTAKLDVTQDNNKFALIVGADSTANTRTDSTTKYARIGMPHYLAAQSPFTLLMGVADSTDNSLYFGGWTGAGNAATVLSFYTGANNTSAAGTERMRIDNAGKVGINTTSPDRRLDILDASSPQLRLTQADNTTYADFQMNSSGDLVMNVDGVSNQLVLDNGGNVGIGTATPVLPLQVLGNARFGADAKLEIGTSVAGGYSYISAGTPDYLAFYTAGTEKVRLSDAGGLSIGNGFVATDPGAGNVIISGSVGIGKSIPLFTLDVAGSASISGTLSLGPLVRGQAGTCNAVNAGKEYYDGIDNKYYFCNGSSWTAFGSGSGSGSSNWTVDPSGTISPNIPTLDLLLGSTSTASAKFAFTGVAGSLGTVPTASISGTAPVATYIDGNGNISTTNRAPLVLGNSATYNTTGNILLNPNGTGFVGIGTTNPSTNLDVVASGTTGNVAIHNYATSPAAGYRGYGASGTEGSPGALGANNFITFLAGHGYGTGFSATANGLIAIKASELFTGSANGTYITLETTPNGSLTRAERVRVDNAGNVGINTTNPVAKLHVLDSTATTADIVYATASAITSGSILNLGYGGTSNFNGNVLNMDVNSYGGGSFTGNYLNFKDNGLTMFLATASGSFAAAGVGQFGGSTATTYSRFGTSTTTQTAVMTTPSDLLISGDLELKGNLYLDNNSISNSAGAATIGLSSNLTTTSSSLQAAWLVDNQVNVGKAALIVNQASTVNNIFSASQAGSLVFSIANNGDTTIGASGLGKATAGTFDPPYTINGSQYATYLPGMAGVKEEATGNVQTSEYVAGVGYRNVIDFTNLPQGSDLWLFSKATDIRNNIGSLVALLTPSDATRVWYQVDSINDKLAIYSAQPTTVSYRLTAPRFDAQDHPNTRSGGVPGFVLNIPDVINTNAIATTVQSLSGFVTQNIGGGVYVLKDSSGTVIDGLESIGNFVAANIKAGAIQSQEIATNSLTAFQGTIDNMLISSGLVAGNIQTKLISPLVNSDSVTVQIGSSATSSGTFAIQNAQGTQVASVDTAGNATFSGVVRSQNIDQIQALLNQVQADQNVLLAATSGATLTSTSSANLASLITGDLYVTNQAAINSLSVSTTLTLGTDMVFGSSGNSIDTLSAPLKIQSLAMAPVEIMDGLVTIDTHGNVNIAGNLAVNGRVKASGLTLTDNPLVATSSAELLTLQNSVGSNVATIDASGSATFGNLSTQGLTIAAGANATTSAVVNGVITTNATAGSAVIPAGTSEITIKNPKVTDYTLVYVTPTSTTQNSVLYVKSKQAGQFIVGFDQPLTLDVNFNWWVIQVQQ